MKDVSAEFIAKEEAETKRPSELYHIWREGGVNWRYTSLDDRVVYGGYTYEPAALNRSEVKWNSNVEVTELTIRIGYLNDPVLQFVAMNPVEVLWVSIMRIHLDMDPIVADVIFLGQIKSVSFKGVQAEAKCVGFEHVLRKPVPTWRYQINCNHWLFDAKCTKNRNDYKVTTIVTIDSTKIKLSAWPAFSDYADRYFTLGTVVFNGIWRTITAHVGVEITVAYQIPGLISGSVVDVYPGCDRRAETCRDKFNNTVNFLGFPFIPKENPSMRTFTAVNTQGPGEV